MSEELNFNVESMGFDELKINLRAAHEEVVKLRFQILNLTQENASLAAKMELS